MGRRGNGERGGRGFGGEERVAKAGWPMKTLSVQVQPERAPGLDEALARDILPNVGARTGIVNRAGVSEGHDGCRYINIHATDDLPCLWVLLKGGRERAEDRAPAGELHDRGLPRGSGLGRLPSSEGRTKSAIPVERRRITERGKRHPRRPPSPDARLTGSLMEGRTMHEQARYFVGWGTLSLINAGLAQAKGRSGLLWWLLSLLLGPFATFLIVVLPAVPAAVYRIEAERPLPPR
jgi:hypothetical protein